jgi:hypothetical protein
MAFPSRTKQVLITCAATSVIRICQNITRAAYEIDIELLSD